MNNQQKERDNKKSVTDDIGHDKFSPQIFPYHINTSEQSTADLTCEFTDGEKSTALQTIIQHMIDVYGYKATRTEFLKLMFNHTLAIEGYWTNNTTPSRGKMSQVRTSQSFMNVDGRLFLVS